MNHDQKKNKLGLSRAVELPTLYPLFAISAFAHLRKLRHVQYKAHTEAFVFLDLTPSFQISRPRWITLQVPCSNARLWLKFELSLGRALLPMLKTISAKIIVYFLHQRSGWGLLSSHESIAFCKSFLIFDTTLWGSPFVSIPEIAMVLSRDLKPWTSLTFDFGHFNTCLKLK